MSSAAAVAPAVQVLQRVRGGASVALVSDAGVPAVSDPGAQLVAAAIDAGLPVVPVPGEAAHAAVRQCTFPTACWLCAAAASKTIHSILHAGPSAVLAALVASGLSCDAFHFVGFLPAKPGQRQKQLQQLAGVAPVTLCFKPCLCHPVSVHAVCLLAIRSQYCQHQRSIGAFPSQRLAVLENLEVERHSRAQDFRQP